MFDGLDRLPKRDPAPPRPAPLDTRALVPMLRAQAAEAAVETLAVVAANNAATVGEWLKLNWGVHADIRDAAHPARVAGLDPRSPMWKLAEAVDALATACRRYRAATGKDGLDLAMPVIAKFGDGVLDYVLKLLKADERLVAQGVSQIEAGASPEPLTSTEISAAIDELLSPEPEAPTQEQWTAGRSAIAEWMLSFPELDGLSERLGALLSACKASGHDCAAASVSSAWEAVSESVTDALLQGFDPECMQAALDSWAAGTGGPRINLNVVRAES